MGSHSQSSGWSQNENDFDGTFTNMDYSLSQWPNNGYSISSYSDPGYGTQNGGYFQPADSFPYQTMEEEVPLEPLESYDGLGGSEGYLASYSYTPAALGHSFSGWGPPTTAGTSTGRLPLRESHGGERQRSEAIYEDGDSEGEPEEHNHVVAPPPPPHLLQPGELANFESLYEGGNYQGETREQGFMPDRRTAPEGEYTAESVGEGSARPSLRNMLLLHRRGLLVPGTLQRYTSEHTQGEHEQEDVQYARYGSY